MLRAVGLLTVCFRRLDFPALLAILPLVPADFLLFPVRTGGEDFLVAPFFFADFATDGEALLVWPADSETAGTSRQVINAAALYKSLRSNIYTLQPRLARGMFARINRQQMPTLRL